MLLILHDIGDFLWLFGIDGLRLYGPNLYCFANMYVFFPALNITRNFLIFRPAMRYVFLRRFRILPLLAVLFFGGTCLRVHLQKSWQSTTGIKKTPC